MSPSSSIRPRQTSTKGTTYQVRFRPGGRDTGWKVVATFPTLREARACKQWVDGELSAGRRPNLRERLAIEPKTVAELAAEFGATHDGESARKRHRNTVKRLGLLGTRAAAQVTGREVQAWIHEQRGGERPLSASSTRQYLSELRRIFAWGEVTPNPADWPHLKVAPDDADGHPVDPPSLHEFAQILATISPVRYREPLRVLEATGMRINELVRLTHGDVDRAHGRIRVPGSKTDAARRFVPMMPAVEKLIDAQAPAIEDRVGPIFPGLSENGLRHAMGRACKFAGIRHFHPHDLRDRFISLCGLAGVPLPLIRDMAGHTKNTITLDIYTGVILDEPPARLDALREAVARMSGLARQPSPDSDSIVAESLEA